MEQNSRILQSKNGWTNNKLYMEWMRNCFELETKHHYLMLIIDGHASHISTKFI